MKPTHGFECECIDRETSRSFYLFLPGPDEKEAAQIAYALGFVTGPMRPKEMRRSPKIARHRRDGAFEQSTEVNDVIGIVRRDDLNSLIRVLDVLCHPLDRHFLLQNIAEAAYSLRNSMPDAIIECERACWQWYLECAQIIPALLREWADENYILKVRVNVPKRLAILLEKRSELSRAVGICDMTRSRLPLHREDMADLEWRAAKMRKKAKGTL